MARSLVFFFAISLVLPWLACAEAVSDVGRARLSNAFRNAQPIGNNVYSVAGKKSAERKKEKGVLERLAELKDDDVLVSIEGGDTLKWGLLRRHVEALCSGIDRPDMQVEGNAAAKKIVYQARLRKLLKDYLEYGVFAVEAKRLGLKIGPEKFEEFRAKAREGYSRMGDTGKALLGLMESGESFYEHNLTNALYWLAYKEQVAAPMCETDDGEIAKMIQIRHAANLSVVTTNLQKKALISEIYGKLRDGMDFGEAAEKWSDSESSVTRGVVMDALDEHPERFAEGDLPEAVEAAIKGLKEGETSGIVETPEAWHIVRLMKRNVPEDGGDATVEIAQIVLEKRMLEPELSPAGSRRHIEALKMKAVMKSKFHELFTNIKVDSKIPLWEPSDPSKRRVKVRKIK